MNSSVCIVGGCGHVGLPLGIALARAGTRACLYDIDEARVREVRGGHVGYRERGADAALTEALATGRLEVTASPGAIGAGDVVVVTIGTPVDEFLDPRVRSFDLALDDILANMRAGQLLLLRSTVFPGVTDRLARRMEERGLDVDVAYCPERVAQGYALEELCHFPQIVGGATARAVRRAGDLFGLLGVGIIELSPIEAELAKLFTNAFRYINFAISNQFYLIAQNFGADFHRIYAAVTRDYPRMAGFAPAGFVGGPCLLKDTMQLGAFNHNTFGIGQAAMTVNEGLPRAMVDAVKGRRDLRGDTAAILGMAFKGGSDDPRASLSYKLRKVLTLECRRVICTDPHIQDPEFVPLERAIEEADIVFLGACHEEYRDLVIRKPVVDVFNFLKRAGP